jgi:hypothetical protein
MAVKAIVCKIFCATAQGLRVVYVDIRVIQFNFAGRCPQRAGKGNHQSGRNHSGNAQFS